MAAGYGGWQLYKKWEPPRLAKRAQRYLEQGNLADARLAIGQALNINPNDIAVNRLMADIAEKSSDSSAVGLRSRLMDLQPESLNAALDCAETALRFRMPGTAESALRKASEQGKGRSSVPRGVRANRRGFEPTQPCGGAFCRGGEAQSHKPVVPVPPRCGASRTRVAGGSPGRPRRVGTAECHAESSRGSAARANEGTRSRITNCPAAGPSQPGI
jgi:hypothetical protein